VNENELVPERQARLAAYIQERGSAHVDELAQRFRISAATVRRDLGVLEEQGLARRVHGGVVALRPRLEEPLFGEKESMASGEKQRIAAEALKMVVAGSTIYLDGGSTVLELARLLADRTDVTVVTNSLRAALELAGRGPRLILVGGELRRLSQTTVGALTRFVLGQIRVEMAFMGTMGFSVPEGMTTSDPNEAYTKELAMRSADRVLLLADSGKARQVAFARVADLRRVHTLITDDDFPAALEKSLKQNGTTVVRV
jgi:DeoR/GlpR family transcriptional regulator of sugar metabolism